MMLQSLSRIFGAPEQGFDALGPGDNYKEALPVFDEAMRRFCQKPDLENALYLNRAHMNVYMSLRSAATKYPRHHTKDILRVIGRLEPAAELMRHTETNSLDHAKIVKKQIENCERRVERLRILADESIDIKERLGQINNYNNTNSPSWGRAQGIAVQPC